jgi:hypothetical protein
MNEADEEHHLAKVLIAELDTIGSENQQSVRSESQQMHQVPGPR